MTYECNIRHIFDVTLNVCYMSLIPWLSMSYYTIKVQFSSVQDSNYFSKLKIQGQEPELPKM